MEKIKCHVGETFTIGNMEFIRFPEVDEKAPVVMKDVAFRCRFGNNNDLRRSDVLKKMEVDILPWIVEAIGEENVCTFTTDLTTLDGLKAYDGLESKISLPTLDFYRKNVSIFDKYPGSNWWWLATPESARPHSSPDWILCVSPSGYISNYYYDDVIGVRPFLLFNSSIFESSEE